jgi:hypothetical protein
MERVRKGALKYVCAFVSVCGCVGRLADRASAKAQISESSTSLELSKPAGSQRYLTLPGVRAGVVVTPPAARVVAAPPSDYCVPSSPRSALLQSEWGLHLLKQPGPLSRTRELAFNK